MRINYSITSLLTPVFILALAVMATAQPGDPGLDVLFPLKATLLNAGASELTSDQESSILTLINEFRNTHQIPTEDMNIQSAREEYENAILNSDYDTAASQALILADAQAVAMALREKDAAVFAIETIAILKKNSGQYEALIDQVGQNGMVKMVLSLVGGPGNGGPRHGPGEPPPPKAPPLY